MCYVLRTLRSLTDSMLKLLIFFLFSERDEEVKSSEGFLGNACSHWTSASRKYFCVLCTLFFDRHWSCDIQIMWIWKQMDRKVIIISLLAYIIQWNDWCLSVLCRCFSSNIPTNSQPKFLTDMITFGYKTCSKWAWDVQMMRCLFQGLNKWHVTQRLDQKCYILLRNVTLRAVTNLAFVNQVHFSRRGAVLRLKVVYLNPWKCRSCCK